MAKNRKVSVVNYRRLWEESPNPVDINDLYLESRDTNFMDALFSQSDGNADMAPTCKCHAYRGKIFEHHVCPYCLEPVESDFTKSFKPTNWIRVPEDMPPILHPRIYILLWSLGGRVRTRTKTGKIIKRATVKIIDYILDPEEILPEDLAVGIHGQGFSYFGEHMDEIMQFLLLEHPKFSKTAKAMALWHIYEKERDDDNVLIRRLPLLNPKFHRMHIRGRMKTVDKLADTIMPVVTDMFDAAYSNKYLVTQPQHADKSLWGVYTQYVKYLKMIMEFKIGDKYAIVRRHNVAARLHFTGRGVISPIIERHEADEIHFPWNIAMMCFMAEIINLLCNRHGYTPTDAVKYFYQHINVYTPLLDNIFKTLIRECVAKGPLVILNRNPTLIRESERLVFMTKVKTDPNDKTINLSSVICKGFNADNDGDEMNMFLIKENGHIHALMRMHPKEGILSEVQLSVSDWVAPTKEAFIHINQFLSYGREDTGDCRIELPVDRSVITDYARLVKTQ